jgi:arabinofuranosyltransferase
LDRTPARSRRRLLAGAALLALSLAHTWRFRFHVTDDAYISFRYVANFLEGHGLVYNPGERVWGFTNFLWMALLAPGLACGLDPLALARALGVLSSAGALLLVLRVGAPARPARGWNPGGACLLATSGAYLLQALGGLETSGFTLLVLAALALHARARERGGRAAFAAGLAAALAALTRPEGVLLFGLLAADALAPARTSPVPLRRRLALLGLGFAPIALAFEAAMASYYGALWPNSLDAKIGLSLEQLRRGLHYGLVFARNQPVTLAIALAAALRWREARPDERLRLWALLLFAAVAVAVGGDWMLGYRLFHAPIALAAGLVPLALAGVAAGGAPRRARKARAGLVALAAVANLAGSFRDPRVEVASRPTLVAAGERIGRWMRAHLPADALLATNTAGCIPYYSGLRIVDMMGINDRTIARRRELPSGWKGIEKGDGRYVLSRRPDYIQLGSFLGASVPLFLSDIELFGSEEFHRRYELVRFEVDPETTLQIWRRREREREPLGPAERARIQRIARRQLALSAFRY